MLLEYQDHLGATAAARAVTDLERRSALLMETISAMEDGALLSDCLEVAAAIPVTDLRDQALASLADTLANSGESEEAITAATRISGQETRAEAFHNIASHALHANMQSGQWDIESVCDAIAEAIEDPGERDSFLARIAIETVRAEQAEKVFDITDNMTDPLERVRVLLEAADIHDDMWDLGRMLHGIYRSR